MRQTEIMDISEVCRVVKRVIREEPTPMDVVQAARDAVQTMCEEAAKYGLTPADIVKGVLHPVFEVVERKRGATAQHAEPVEMIQPKSSRCRRGFK